MKKLAFTAVLTLAGCHAVNHADAVTLANAIDQIAKADIADPDQQTRVLMQACAGVPFCAQKCKKELLAAGSGPEVNAGPLIANCSEDYRKAPSVNPSSWFRSYLRGRLDVALTELNDADRAKLTEATSRINGLH